MAFNTAITGLKASTVELDVTGNNIANSSTVGFKSGRTEFSDIFTSVVVGAGSTNNPGAGVIVSDIAQDFTAGTIEFTNNNLDLAIDGTGFFQLNDGQGGISYTRAGGFELDKDGNVVSKSGKFLQGYGLDAAGNQQPISNLAVSEKESPPKATRDLDLSFNIDSRADPHDLREDYSPDDASSFTFSTTSRTFDSLGNENTIKFDFIEQGPWRERQNITINNGAGSTNVTFAGVTITGTTLAGPIAVAAAVKDEFDNNRDAFPGTISSLIVNPTKPEELVITYKASAADVDNIAVGPADAVVTHAEGSPNSRLPASEVQTLDINPPPGSGATITIGSGTSAVNVAIEASDATPLDVINRIKAQESAIKAANPNIESIDANDAKTGLVITYKPEAGEVDELVVDDAGSGIFDIGEQQTLTITGEPTADGNVEVVLGTGDILTVPVLDADDAAGVATKIAAFLDANPVTGVSATLDISGIDPVVTFVYDPQLGDMANMIFADDATAPSGVIASPATPVEYANVSAATQEVAGDNSYQGVYQMYAYLNGTEELDIGVESTTGPLDPGPILLQFDTTDGTLKSIDGDEVPASNIAKLLNIRGADPAAADPTQEGNVIKLDLTGTTQFASESIVKASTQDGYTKGDLIGVAFAENGTMVASFSNGQNSSLGIVALASFENQGGLQPTGSTEWKATLDSGQAILNPPGAGLNGSLRSAALEQSNVNLSEELVALIEAQRNFQANSKTLQTENSVTQTILQIQ